MVNKSLIVMLIISAIIFVLWFAGLIMPQSNKITRLNGEIDEFVKLEKQQVSDNTIQLMMLKLDRLTTDIKDVKAHFYPEDEILDLGRRVEKIGENHGLEFISISPEEFANLDFFKGDNKDVTELPIVIEFKGIFKELTDFLDSVEEFPFIIRLNDIKIINGDVRSQELNIYIKGNVVIARSGIN